MGHTDVVPVNPDGWSHDPFGGELIDGEVWGRGAIDMLNLTASMAVAFKHLATHGLQAEGHADLLRCRRRGGRRAVRRRVGARAPPRRAPQRLRAHRARRLVVDRPRWHPPLHGQRRREGTRLAPLAHHRHARPRLDAVRLRQRAGQGGRGRAPLVDVPAGRPDQRHLARPGGGDVAARRSPRRPHRSRSPLADARATPDVGGPDVPRHDAHDDLAERRPRRPEDERHPRCRRPRGRHPHGAGHDERGRRGDARRCPRRSRTPCRGEHPPGLRRRPSHRLRTRCGTRSRPALRSPTPVPSSSPGSSSAAPTPVTSATAAPSPTAPGCSRRR